MNTAHEPSPAMSALAHAVSAARKALLPPAVARWAQSAYERCASRCATLEPAADAYQRALGAGSASGDPVFGATLALAERTGSDGNARLQAYAVGSEIRLRVAGQLRAPAAAPAWDERGTAGVIGAAVAAATLLGLECDPIVRAFGIAASETVGFGCVRGTGAAQFLAGKAAANGAIAALLASDRFTACAGLDPGRGFLALVAYPQGQDARRRAAACDTLAQGFGTRWMLVEGDTP